MFMPMASPVEHLKRRYALRPARVTSRACRRPKREVPSNTVRMRAKFSGAATHARSAAAAATEGIFTSGARVMPSAPTTVATPPARRSALAPRFVDATSAPSVVAKGTRKSSPSTGSGPTTPSGYGRKPITDSQLVPSTVL